MHRRDDIDYRPTSPKNFGYAFAMASSNSPATVGVTPSVQGQGIGRRLIEPSLAEADDAGVDCYLETFDRRNPAFYERLGFSAVASHAEPVTGATYTIMCRKPKTSRELR